MSTNMKDMTLLLLLLLLEKTDLSCRMPKLQGQVTKSIKQYNNDVNSDVICSVSKLRS